MNEHKINEQLLISTINYIQSVPTGNNTLSAVNTLIKELSNCAKVDNAKEAKKPNGNIK